MAEFFTTGFGVFVIIVAQCLLMAIFLLLSAYFMLPVILAGPLAQEALIDVMREASVVALPCVVSASGDRDGLPTVLLEGRERGAGFPGRLAFFKPAAGADG